MSDVIFLTTVRDPVTPTTVYGAGHKVALAEATFRQFQAEGKVAAQGADPFNIRVTAIGTTTATVSFDVDRPLLSANIVYGTTTALTPGNQAVNPSAAPGTVTGNLTGLITATTYYYAITVGTEGAFPTGQNQSRTYSFRTL